MAPDRHGRRLRADLAALTDLAGADIRRAWSRFNTPQEARDALERMLPKLTQVYGAAAATLAADWYDELREELGVPKQFRAIVAPAPDDDGASELARWGVGPLFQEKPDVSAAQSLITGGLQRRIVNQSRATITASSLADPQAGGWQRVGSGSCTFCAMLIGRGAVYSEGTADFSSHDHCNCSATPAFGGQPIAVKRFKPSERKGNWSAERQQSENQRVYDWLRDNPQ